MINSSSSNVTSMDSTDNCKLEQRPVISRKQLTFIVFVCSLPKNKRFLPLGDNI
jgi:hypothetical protein